MRIQDKFKKKKFLKKYEIKKSICVIFEFIFNINSHFLPEDCPLNFCGLLNDNSMTGIELLKFLSQSL